MLLEFIIRYFGYFDFGVLFPDDSESLYSAKAASGQIRAQRALKFAPRSTSLLPEYTVFPTFSTPSTWDEGIHSGGTLAPNNAAVFAFDT